MKICILTNNYYRSSGVTVAIRRLVSAMLGHGCEFYFAGCGAPTEGHLSPTEDLTWIPAGRYRQFDLSRTGCHLPAELARFCQWLKDIDCDVVHAHHRRLACLANIAYMWHRVPVLFTAHGIFPKTAWFWALCPATVTGVSPSVMKYLERCTASSTRILTCNPYPFPEAVADVSTRPVACRSRAVSIGRLEPEKGQVHLIDAWRILQNWGLEVTLDIYGEGHLRSELVEKVTAEGLAGRVRFPGFCPDVSQEFRTSLFNVLVSQGEGLPNVVVEAAAEGVPTLLNDVAGCRDVIPEVTVLPNRLAFGDVQELANALAAWFASPGLVADDGLRFHDFLRERVSVEAVRSQYEQIYYGLSRGMALSGVGGQ